MATKECKKASNPRKLFTLRQNREGRRVTEQIRLHLGFQSFDAAAREALSHFLREEALHLDHLAALVAQAETFLRDHQVLLPALSTSQGERLCLGRLYWYSARC